MENMINSFCRMKKYDSKKYENFAPFVRFYLCLEKKHKKKKSKNV
jgi:hypothetical protein